MLNATAQLLNHSCVEQQVLWKLGGALSEQGPSWKALIPWGFALPLWLWCVAFGLWSWWCGREFQSMEKSVRTINQGCVSCLFWLALVMLFSFRLSLCPRGRMLCSRLWCPFICWRIVRSSSQCLEQITSRAQWKQRQEVGVTQGRSGSQFSCSLHSKILAKQTLTLSKWVFTLLWKRVSFTGS